MNDPDPIHPEPDTFPPALMMTVSAVAVHLHERLNLAAVQTWRKTLEVFVSGVRLQIEEQPCTPGELCLLLSAPGGIEQRRKAMVLSWLSLSPAVRALRVRAPSDSRGKGLTLLILRSAP